MATGWCTLDADARGGICPIGDLLKTEVFEMSKYINYKARKEVIPTVLLPDELYRFELAPTAELGEFEKDPFRWGYHDAVIEQFTDYQKKTAEDVAKWYLNGELEQRLSISNELVRRWDLHDPKTFIEDIQWLYSRSMEAVLKRIQAPPIIILSKSAFGEDIEESILWIPGADGYNPTQEFEELKAEVLKMGVYNPKVMC